MHKVFISYHHQNDQLYKNQLLEMNRIRPMFIDASVDIGDIPDYLDDQAIRQKIRDEYLKESSVTIVLVGTETKRRKHVDWEIYSSMYDGVINKKSGILVINLPSVNCTDCTASHAEEKERIYSEISSWITITDRAEYERRYPYMPERIIDNLLVANSGISVVSWEKINYNFDNLEFLIDVTFKDRLDCKYDLSRSMRRANS